jgi:hypothetical protein
VNEWVHVAFVVSKKAEELFADIKIFFDGALVAHCNTETYHAVSNKWGNWQTQKLLIGRAAPASVVASEARVYPASFYRGHMKDLRLHQNEVMTIADVQAERDAGTSCRDLNQGINGDVFSVSVDVAVPAWEAIDAPVDFVTTSTGSFYVYGERVNVTCTECKSGFEYKGRIVFAVNTFSSSERCDTFNSTRTGSCYAVASDTRPEDGDGLLEPKSSSYYTIHAYKGARSLTIAVEFAGTVMARSTALIEASDADALEAFTAKDPGLIRMIESLPGGKGAVRGLCVRYSQPGCCPRIELTATTGDSGAYELMRAHTNDRCAYRTSAKINGSHSYLYHANPSGDGRSIDADFADAHPDIGSADLGSAANVQRVSGWTFDALPEKAALRADADDAKKTGGYSLRFQSVSTITVGDLVTLTSPCKAHGLNFSYRMGDIRTIGTKFVLQSAREVDGHWVQRWSHTLTAEEDTQDLWHTESVPPLPLNEFQGVFYWRFAILAAPALYSVVLIDDIVTATPAVGAGWYVGPVLGGGNGAATPHSYAADTFTAIAPRKGFMLPTSPPLTWAVREGSSGRWSESELKVQIECAAVCAGEVEDDEYIFSHINRFCNSTHQSTLPFDNTPGATVFAGIEACAQACRTTASFGYSGPTSCGAYVWSDDLKQCRIYEECTAVHAQAVGRSLVVLPHVCTARLPTAAPTAAPTRMPTAAPTPVPTASPTVFNGQWACTSVRSVQLQKDAIITAEGDALRAAQNDGALQLKLDWCESARLTLTWDGLSDSSALATQGYWQVRVNVTANVSAMVTNLSATAVHVHARLINLVGEAVLSSVQALDIIEGGSSVVEIGVCSANCGKAFATGCLATDEMRNMSRQAAWIACRRRIDLGSDSVLLAAGCEPRCDSTLDMLAVGPGVTFSTYPTASTRRRLRALSALHQCLHASDLSTDSLPSFAASAAGANVMLDLVRRREAHRALTEANVAVCTNLLQDEGYTLITNSPTTAPTQAPTGAPTSPLTSAPTLVPTNPSAAPTKSPTAAPTFASFAPTAAPTAAPTFTSAPEGTLSPVGDRSYSVVLKLRSTYEKFIEWLPDAAMLADAVLEASSGSVRVQDYESLPTADFNTSLTSASTISHYSVQKLLSGSRFSAYGIVYQPLHFQAATRASNGSAHMPGKLEAHLSGTHCLALYGSNLTRLVADAESALDFAFEGQYHGVEPSVRATSYVPEYRVFMVPSTVDGDMVLSGQAPYQLYPSHANEAGAWASAPKINWTDFAVGFDCLPGTYTLELRTRPDAVAPPQCNLLSTPLPGGKPIRVRIACGTNTNRLVTSGCKKCEAGYFGSTDQSTTCAPCGDNALTLTGDRSGRDNGDDGATSAEQCFCADTYYNAMFDTDTPLSGGIECKDCPTGASCQGYCPSNRSPKQEGDLEDGCGQCTDLTVPCHAKPVPKSGYWALAESPASIRKCEPEDSCLGGYAESGVSCAPGYAALACSACDADYFRQDGKCEKCPADASFTILIYCITAALLFVSLGWFHHKLRWRLYRLVPLFNIGLHYVQLLSSLAVLAVWPESIRKMLDMFSLFNLNIDFISVECVNPAFNFRTKFLVIQVLPFALAVGLFVLRLVHLFVKAVSGPIRTCFSCCKKHELNLMGFADAHATNEEAGSEAADVDGADTTGGLQHFRSARHISTGGSGDDGPGSSDGWQSEAAQQLSRSPKFGSRTKSSAKTPANGSLASTTAGTSLSKYSASSVNNESFAHLQLKQHRRSAFTGLILPIMNPLLIMLICLYQLLVLRVFQVFVCTQADENNWVLTAEPRIVCEGFLWPRSAVASANATVSDANSGAGMGTAGEHVAMVREGLIFSALTVVGIPLFFAAILFQRNRATGEYRLQLAQLDLHEAMQETGWNPDSYRKNEGVYHVLYGCLISYFRPEYWYWILVLLVRKCLLAAALCVQTGLPAFNLNLAAGVVLGAYVLQIKCRPYEHFDIPHKHWSKRNRIRRGSSVSRKMTNTRSKHSAFYQLGLQIVDPNWLEEVSLLVCLIVILAGSTFSSINYEEDRADGEAANLPPNFYSMRNTMEQAVLILGPTMVVLLGLGSMFELRESAVASADHSDFSKKLPLISKKLRMLPTEDPPPDSADYYALSNPVHGSDQQKLEGLKKLRCANKAILQSFFETIYDGYGLECVGTAEEVAHGCIFVKSNSKTDTSTLEKARRPTILAVSPRYGLEHVRDHFRFKCVVNNVIDAFLFLQSLVESEQWEVIKFDIDKFVAPKEWGWRFLGCDIRMANGQMVEAYVVFEQMDHAKKNATRPDLSPDSQHEIYEQWRASDPNLLEPAERAEYDEHASISRRVYNSAFYKTLEHTSYDEWKSLFCGFGEELQLKAHKLYVKMIEHKGDLADVQIESASVVHELLTHLPLLKRTGSAADSNAGSHGSPRGAARKMKGGPLKKLASASRMQLLTMREEEEERQRESQKRQEQQLDHGSKSTALGHRRAKAPIERDDSVRKALEIGTGKEYYYNRFTKKTGWNADEVSRTSTLNEYGLEEGSDEGEDTLGHTNPMFVKQSEKF